ncbi:E3 ubiquitin-protein ligase TRIM56-like [Ambystoma mexicanum]|uniref:E3 ubiquitin-protein ligase TRIM56-like n=1 Tax=Ambystoma mexicanum TaxID=8296 RepID=UPI0037E84991
MARIVTSLDDVLAKDFLTCGICSDMYKSPKILPCLHSYCQECLGGLVKEECLACPGCHLTVNVNDGVSSLKTSAFISGLVGLVQSRTLKDSGDVCCSACLKTLPATARCLDCASFLCQTCIDGLPCSSLGHKLVDLKEFLTGKHDAEIRARQQVPCQYHALAPLALFCDTCNTSICTECRLLNHLEHRVLPMSEACLEKKLEVSELIGVLESSAKTLSDSEQEMDDDLEMVLEASKGIDESIHSYVDNVSALLLEQKEATLGELDVFLKKKMEQHVSAKQELQSQKEKSRRAQELAQKVVDVGKDYEIMSMGDLIRDRVKELQKFTPQQLDIQIPELDFGLDKKVLLEFQHFKLRLFIIKSEGSVTENQKSDSLGISLPSKDVFPTRLPFALSGANPPVKALPPIQVLHKGHSLPPKLTYFFKENYTEEDSYDWSGEYDSSDDYGSTDEGATSDGDDWFLSRMFPPPSPRPICVCTFEINQFLDFTTPKITGVTVSSSGDILMCDKANDDIKWFSPDGVAGNCTLPPEPEGSLPLCGLAMCGDILVCSSGCFLLFLSLEEKLLQKIKLRGTRAPYSIASYKSQYVAVSEGTLCSVSLYSTSGQCVGRIQPRGWQGGKFLFIAVNSKEIFIVSDFYKKVILLFQKSGEVVNVLDTNTPLLREPFSLCVDARDHIFVVDQERVLEFTPDGEFGRVLLSAANGVEEPRVLAVDKKRRLILVHKQDYAKIFQLR